MVNTFNIKNLNLGSYYVSNSKKTFYDAKVFENICNQDGTPLLGVYQLLDSPFDTAYNNLFNQKRYEKAIPKCNDLKIKITDIAPFTVLSKNIKLPDKVTFESAISIRNYLLPKFRNFCKRKEYFENTEEDKNHLYYGLISPVENKIEASLFDNPLSIKNTKTHFTIDSSYHNLTCLVTTDFPGIYRHASTSLYVIDKNMMANGDAFPIYDNSPITLQVEAPIKATKLNPNLKNQVLVRDFSWYGLANDEIEKYTDYVRSHNLVKVKQ